MKSESYDSIAEYYAQWAAGDSMFEACRTFYRDWCKEKPGRIVEIGVGSGLLLLDLAAHNRPVTGIDISRPMLANCALKARQAGLHHKISLCQMDWFHLGLKNVNILLMPFRTITHILEREQRRVFLKDALASLAPDGYFVLDHFIFDFEPQSGDYCARQLMHESLTEQGSYKIWNIYEYGQRKDRMRCFVDIRHTKDGQELSRMTLPFDLALIDPAEFLHDALEVGFDVDALYGDFNRGPFTGKSQDQVWVLKRNT